MSSSPPIGLRIVLVLASTACALGLGWAWVLARGEGDGILLTIDNSREVEDVLTARADGRPLESVDGLRREPVDEEMARTFFPALRTPGYVYDPHAYYMREPHQFTKHHASEEYPDGWTFRTNAQGLREDEDVLATKPDLRILVTGDSHTGGVVPNDASFTNVLEAALAERRPGETVEALNAGLGGYSFYNYLGILEKFEHLEPDLFIVACYGGNDFSGVLPMYRFFNREKGPSVDARWRSDFDDRFGRAGNILSQELNQAVILDRGPGQIETATTAVTQVTAEILARCRERGIGLVCVYIPPPLRAQPERHAARTQEYIEAIGLRPAALSHSDQIADAWLAFLAQHGVPALDLRPIFQARDEELYWPSNSHINTLANQLVAEELLPLVEEALRAGS